jgi:hypothetical protein
MPEEKKLAKNVYLFREGDTSDSMYIIKSGELVVTKTKGNSEVILAEIHAGSMVGEMALFDNKPRSANVKAIKDSEVMILPYESLNKQLEQLPVWVKSIIKKLNDNIRDSNKKIKVLETITNEDERFPPHILNKYLSILVLVCHKYGKLEPNGGLSFSKAVLLEYTVQVFQEAANKMQSVLNALSELGHLTQADPSVANPKIINVNPAKLSDFVSWYKSWLFDQDKGQLQPLSDFEIKILNGLLHFARKSTPDQNGLCKFNLVDVQNNSAQELGFFLKINDEISLTTKRYLSERIPEGSDLYIITDRAIVEPLASNWAQVNEIKKRLAL